MASGSVMRVELRLDAMADAAELDAETSRLREELLQLDVEDVGRPRAEPGPEGTRAAEAAVLGTLLVAFGRDTIVAVVRSIADWVARAHNRSVTLTLGGDSIELSSASADDQRRILDAFLARHANSVE